MRRIASPQHVCRRQGFVLVLAAVLLVVVFGFLAFTVDVGYMAFEKARLQNAADFAALGAAVDIPIGEAAVRLSAQQIAAENESGGVPVLLADSDIELGIFDFEAKTFSPGATHANAVRVTARLQDQPFFFAPVFGHDDFDMSAQAIGMLNPRDIVFVVDTSGSMNDDTEPCWATGIINSAYGPVGYPDVATYLMQDVFSDFGYGPYPGETEHFGEPLGAPQNEYAYAEMTKDGGLLSSSAIPSKYRISSSDSESTRKMKAYSWIIDQQIAVIMPNALPTPNSSLHYAYWEKYLDYLNRRVSVGYSDYDGGSYGGSGGGGSGYSAPTPPTGMLDAFDAAPLSLHRGPVDLGQFAAIGPILTSSMHAAGAVYGDYSPGVPRNGSYSQISVPTSKDSDEVDDFNNPNRSTFPEASTSLPKAWRYTIGYLTYVQFMMDWGRDCTPLGSSSTAAASGSIPKVPLSLSSPFCPLHPESTAGGTFMFPPREQPMHATRRALIAAIQVCKERNELLVGNGDRVAIISFDALDGYHAPVLVQPLTSDFDAAMQSCTTLQAVSDMGPSTAMEAGLILARQHLLPSSEGGQGRASADQVIILLTDGVPNVWISSATDINQHIAEHPDQDYYGSDYVWLNSALRQADLIQGADTTLHAVGVGLGADYDFLDRMSRFSGTDVDGHSPQGSGNPADYEQVTTEIFVNIINNPGSRLVQ